MAELKAAMTKMQPGRAQKPNKTEGFLAENSKNPGKTAVSPRFRLENQANARVIAHPSRKR
jgi:hypothetical protein